MNISFVSAPKISCGCIKSCFVLFVHCFLFVIIRCMCVCFYLEAEKKCATHMYCQFIWCSVRSWTILRVNVFLFSLIMLFICSVIAYIIIRNISTSTFIIFFCQTSGELLFSFFNFVQLIFHQNYSKPQHQAIAQKNHSSRNNRLLFKHTKREDKLQHFHRI